MDNGNNEWRWVKVYSGMRNPGLAEFTQPSNHSFAVLITDIGNIKSTQPQFPQYWTTRFATSQHGVVHT